MAPTLAYVRPTSLSEALDAAQTPGIVIAAGCTDLFPATEHKSLRGKILDVTALEELRGISTTHEGLRIGATTTWTDILRADLPPAVRGLQRAAREVGARQIQNRGTLGGNLCNASPAADGVPPLLTLNAEVELQSAHGKRRMPLSDFLSGPRQTRLGRGEILSAIHVPSQSLCGQSDFLKLGARTYLVISIAMVAVRVDLTGDVVRDIAFAVGACGPVATRLPKIERDLVGKPIDPALIRDADVAAALNPIDDVRADAGYRSASAAELLRRALQRLQRIGSVA